VRDAVAGAIEIAMTLIRGWRSRSNEARFIPHTCARRWACRDAISGFPVSLHPAQQAYALTFFVSSLPHFYFKLASLFFSIVSCPSSPASRKSAPLRQITSADSFDYRAGFRVRPGSLLSSQLGKSKPPLRLLQYPGRSPSELEPSASNAR